jgi:hypothetical protein
MTLITSGHSHAGVMSGIRKPPARAGLDTARAGPQMTKKKTE